MILEIPDLRLPSTDALLKRTWLSLKEFITIAWPLLIGPRWSSVCSSGSMRRGPRRGPRRSHRPSGLPPAVGMTLVFGILRKELTLVMLVQALGTTDVGSVMTPAQLLTFTLFVVFYVPCVATVAAMAKQVGWRDTAWISALTVAVALVIAVAGRVAFTLFT